MSFPIPDATAERCPEILVLRDEIIIWRQDEPTQYRRRSFDPERWRIGRIDRGALARLLRLIETQRFFTTPAEKLESRPDPPLHGTTTTVALKVAGKVRVLPVYSLHFQTDGVTAGPFARGYAAIVNAIRALRPEVSRRYEPDRIKVESYPDHIAKGPAVRWPAWRLPDRYWRWPSGYFSGSEAKEIIDALSKSFRVSFEGKEYVFGWAPAFTLPRDPELLQPVSSIPTSAPYYSDAAFQPGSHNVLLENGRTPGEVTLVRPGMSESNLTWRAHTDAPVGVAWHPGGDLVATGAGGDAVRLWRPPDVGNPTLVEQSSRVRRMAWNPKGTLLAGLHNGKEVRLWRTNGKFVRRLSAGIEPVCLAWSPTGDRLAVGETNGTVRIWNARTWQPLPRISTILPSDRENLQPGALAWNPDGRRLAISRYWIQRLELLDTTTGKLTPLDTSPSQSESLLWSTDGKMLAVYGWDVNCVWRLGRRTEKLTLDGGARALKWDGPTKLVGLREDQLLTWDLTLGRWEPVRKP